MGAHLINALPITYKVHSVQGYQSARDLIVMQSNTTEYIFLLKMKQG